MAKSASPQHLRAEERDGADPKILPSRLAGQHGLSVLPGESADEIPHIAVWSQASSTCLPPRPPPGVAPCSSRNTDLPLPSLLCSCHLVSEADGSFAECLTDFPGARPLPGLPPSAGRCHPTRRVPPAWFDSHLGGLLRAPVSRLLHLVPARLRCFPTGAPADRTGLPRLAR